MLIFLHSPRRGKVCQHSGGPVVVVSRAITTSTPQSGFSQMMQRLHERLHFPYSLQREGKQLCRSADRFIAQPAVLILEKGSGKLLSGLVNAVFACIYQRG